MAAAVCLELVAIGVVMSESLFGAYWYRVAKLKPSLRDTTQISRHVYRGKTWHVLRNSLSGHNHRFNSHAYFLIGHMDGQQTVQNLLDKACNYYKTDAPTQDEIILLLIRLHEADLIQSNILPSTEAIFSKIQGEKNKTLMKRIGNPFYLRFPLCNPEPFLQRLNFLTASLLTQNIFILWLLITFASLLLAILNWPELTGDLNDKLFSMSNLLLIWLIYPIVKILHEFGHAFAVKKWGGEVHEMGIVLLALIPIPYIDASASACFPEKQQRIAVAAVGMMIEMFLAALALIVWLNVETGLISAIAYNVMLISGISTLLFNGNPLLRYDGYYILSDLIEIPNLNQRATLYLGYIFNRYVLGIETAESPVTAHGEKKWFILYGPVSFCYRMVILAGMVVMVSSKFFSIGILIALWGIISMVILPVIRMLSGLLNNPAVRNRRKRLVYIGIGSCFGSMLLFFIIPVSLWTTTQGVVWLPEQSIIRAGTDLEVVEIMVADGSFVSKDTPVIRGADHFLDAEIDICKAQLEELYAMYNAQPLHERVKRKMVLDDIYLAQKNLQQIEKKAEQLLARSPTQGNVLLIDARNLLGCFVKKGDILGYVLSEHCPRIRAVVNQTDIGLIRKSVTDVEVRMAEQVATTHHADIERIVPAPDLNLPTPALGIYGGGNIPVDPSDPERLRALESFYRVDICLPQKMKEPHIGSRVYVRFEHGTMPMAMQWYRSLRQLLIRKFYA